MKALRLSFTGFSFNTLALNRQSVGKLVEAVWDKSNHDELRKQLPATLFNAYNSTYHSAVQGVETELAKHFKNNLSMLAAAKSASIISRLIALRENTAERDLFLKTARSVVNTYQYYTATEYNTMVHRVRVARQMEQFAAERHLYPNIEWLPSRAAKPDMVHKGYWHHIWSQDDPFWQSSFPGCRWGCKCSWRTTDDPVTDKSQLKLVPPSPGLEGNPYHTKELVSSTHPYYKNIQPHITSLGVLLNPDEVVYISYPLEGGKAIHVHYLAMLTKEFAQNIRTAELLTKHGFDNIRLLPQIHRSEVELRNRYFGKAYAKKHPNANPDATIDGVHAEFKKADKNTFSLRLAQSAKKSSIAVISAPGLSEKFILSKMEGIWEVKHLGNLKEVVVLVGDRVLVFKRP